MLKWWWILIVSDLNDNPDVKRFCSIFHNLIKIISKKHKANIFLHLTSVRLHSPLNEHSSNFLNLLYKLHLSTFTASQTMSSSALSKKNTHYMYALQKWKIIKIITLSLQSTWTFPESNTFFNWSKFPCNAAKCSCWSDGVSFWNNKKEP